MSEGWVTIYDIQTAGGVPPYSSDQYTGLIISFVAVSIFFSVLTLLSKKKEPWRWAVMPAVGIFLALYLFLDFIDRRGTISDLAAGKLKLAEGCVTGFDTNHGEPHTSRNSEPDERWTVQHQYFSYKHWSDIPGYHKMEKRGGVVHSGMYLRVRYLISPIYRREEIMKLEVGPKPCNQKDAVSDGN